MKPAPRTCRLSFLVGELSTGGLERQLLTLLSGLDRAAYPPAVVVWEHDPDADLLAALDRLDVPVHGLPRGGSRMVKLRALRRTVGALEPEVLHSYSYFTNFAAWYAMRGRPGCAVGSLRTDYDYERRIAGPVVGRLSARFPRTLIANNGAARDAALRDRGPWAPRRVEIVPNAVDLGRFAAEPWPKGEELRIVGVGRLYPQKAWDDALRALAKLDALGVDGWRFELAGAGPLESGLRRLAAELGLDKRVHFLGFQSDVPSVLARAHVLLLTSHHEGTPNVVLEAMAAARAVVATDCGDVRRLVDDGSTGYVVPVGVPARVADALATLARAPDRGRAMGERGRAKVARAMSPEALALATLDAYRSAGWRG